MRRKKEQRGKPLSSTKGSSILKKLFEGIEGQVIAEEEGVSNATVSKIKRQFPLFFGIYWGDASKFDKP